MGKLPLLKAIIPKQILSPTKFSFEYYKNATTISISGDFSEYYAGEGLDAGESIQLASSSNKVGINLLMFLRYDFEVFDDFVSFINNFGLGSLVQYSITLKNLTDIKTHPGLRDQEKYEILLKTVYNEVSEKIVNIQKHFDKLCRFSLGNSPNWLLNIPIPHRTFAYINRNIQTKNMLKSFDSKVVFDSFAPIQTESISNDELNKFGLLLERYNGYDKVNEFSVESFCSSSENGWIFNPTCYSTLLQKTSQQDFENILINASAKFEIYMKSSFKTFDFGAILSQEFLECVRREQLFYECQNCNKLFLPLNKRQTLFCDKKDSDGKYCKKVGPAKRYRQNRSVIKSLYDHAYKRLNGKLYAQKKKTTFLRWSSEARKKLEYYESAYQESEKSNDLDKMNSLVTDFQNWLTDDSVVIKMYQDYIESRKKSNSSSNR